MPKSITIRDVPDQTAHELASRAAATGRSLQEYLRAQLIDLAKRQDAESWLAGVRARKATTAVEVDVDVVLGHRDADRR